MSNKKVLIVDDQSNWLDLFTDLLEEEFDVTKAMSYSEGMEALLSSDSPFHVVISDIRLEDEDPTNEEGLSLLTELDRVRDFTQFIVVTAHPSIDTIKKSFKDLNAFEYILKLPEDGGDFDHNQFRKVVCQAAQEAQTQRDVSPLVDPYASVKSLTDPQRFFGRQRKQTVQKMVSEILGGVNLAIFGMRRVGKTTLLNQLVLECEKLGHPVAKIVCRPFSAKYTYAKILAEITQEWSRALANLYPDFVIPAHISINIRDSYDEDPNQFKVDVIELADAIQREIGESIRLVLALDEVDYIFPDDNTSLEVHHQYIHFTQILKSVLESPRQPGMLSLVAVMEYPLINDLSSFDVEDQKLSNPLYDRFEKRPLDLLSRGDWEEMVQELGALAGLKYFDESLEILYHESKGHPEISRELGSVLVDLRDSDEIGNFITPQEVYLALNYFLDDQSGYYLETTFWQDLLSTDLDTEQRIITALADAENISKKDLFSKLLSDYQKFIDYKKGRAASDQEVERERHRIEGAWQRLLHLQVITENRQQKTFTISIPIYQKWVRQEILALEVRYA